MGGKQKRVMGVWFATLLATFACASVLAWPADASAQSAQQRSEEAKARYLKGVDLFEEGDYQSALIEFKRSYELVPNFNVLFNIGQVYFQLADYANALRTFQQYVDEGGKRIPPNRRSDVDADLAKLRSRVANVSVKVNVQGAELRVDDQLVASPISGPVMVSAGKRRFEVSKPGFRAVQKTEEIAGQENKELTFELQPEVNLLGEGDGTRPPIVIIGDQRMTQEQPGPPVGPIVSWSLTGAFVVGAGVFGGLALANDSSLEALKKEEGHTEAELEDAASSARNMAIATDVFLAAAVIGAGVSVYFTVDMVLTDDAKATKKRDESAPRPPTAQLKLGPGFTGVAGSF